MIMRTPVIWILPLSLEVWKQPATSRPTTQQSRQANCTHKGNTQLASMSGDQKMSTNRRIGLCRMRATEPISYAPGTINLHPSTYRALQRSNSSIQRHIIHVYRGKQTLQIQYYSISLASMSMIQQN